MPNMYDLFVHVINIVVPNMYDLCISKAECKTIVTDNVEKKRVSFRNQCNIIVSTLLFC